MSLLAILALIILVLSIVSLVDRLPVKYPVFGLAVLAALQFLLR